MKRMNGWHRGGRSYRSAAVKQRILRREERKRLKYRRYARYGTAVVLHRNRNRGV